MISIITLIDNLLTISKSKIIESLTSVIEQTFKEWELKMVLYNIDSETECSNSSNINILDDIKQMDTRIDILKYYSSNVTNLNTPSKIFLTVVNSQCKHNYISILNINDTWIPNKLELQKNVVLKYPDIVVLGTKSCYDKELLHVPEGLLHNSNSFKVNPFINSTTVIKKGILKYVDSFDSDYDSNYSEVSNDLMLNYLWVKLALFEYILYNMTEVTVKHNDISNVKYFMECYNREEFKKPIDKLKLKYIRVKIMSDYCSSEKCKKEYERASLAQNIEYYGKTKKIYFTVSETYTHAILLNCPIVQNLQVSKNNVIGFAQEPHDTPFLRIYQNNFIEYAVKNIGKYFIGSIDKFPQPTFIGHHGFLFYETPKPCPFTPPKSKIMSVMVSHKKYTPGHKYRHILVENILKYNLPVDIWGNGSDLYKQQYYSNKNIKGGFKQMEEMCRDYLFTVAIENTSHDHYFTEKIINPFINNTVPLYWGCKTVEQYFPKHTIHLTGNISNDLTIISNVLSNPKKYLDEYKINQELVLSKVNLIKNIERIFDI